MKFYIKVLVLLVAVFQINNVMAAENIIGTWQGELAVGPGTELTIEFIITQEPDGSYSAVVNSPGGSGIKNIKADSVVYNAGVLKMDVAELSGAYEGVLKDGKIEGNWEQEGTSFPLDLIPYIKTALSKKEMDILMGTWHGKPVPPEGAAIAGEIPTFVFRFETSENGEFVGFVDLPDLGTKGVPVANMAIVGGSFIFEIPNFRSEFKGKIGDKEIVGELKNKAMPNAPTYFTLVKGEYKAKVHKLDLPKEIKDQLLGEWNGPLTIREMSITVVFRFEMTKNGEFVGFHDSPDQGAKGIPITEASLSDGQLTLKIASISGEFNGQLSGDKLDGEWSQVGMKTPLSLKKGKYVAPVYNLSLPKETMDQLSGKWTGKLTMPQTSISLVLRFEKTGKGEFLGFIDSPDQGAKGITITEANLSDGKLTLKIASIGGEFTGQLSDNKLDGTWKQGEMSNPLLLKKEKP